KRLTPGKVGEADAAFVTALKEAMAEDLNTSKALAIVDEMVSDANEALDANPKDKVLKRTVLGNIAFVDELLGFGGSEPYEWFQHGVSDEERTKIEAMIEERNAAKKARDFARADAIRNELSAMGIALMDTPEGTKWEHT
ncbi:DALR domain-containing protein, partial [Nitratifractor sp.]